MTFDIDNYFDLKRGILRFCTLEHFDFKVTAESAKQTVKVLANRRAAFWRVRVERRVRGSIRAT